jgi:hypothetical protein
VISAPPRLLRDRPDALRSRRKVVHRETTLSWREAGTHPARTRVTAPYPALTAKPLPPDWMSVSPQEWPISWHGGESTGRGYRHKWFHGLASRVSSRVCESSLPRYAQLDLLFTSNIVQRREDPH